MKRIILFSLFSIAFAIAGGAFAQTSVRTPVDVTGVQTGVPCDAALGRAMATTATGAMICTDRVSRSSTADTATTADTAQNALNAVNASNLTGTLDAAQITGQLSNTALPSCPDPTKPIPTANGCVAAGGGGGGATTLACTGKSFSRSGVNQYGSNYSVSGSVPSLGDGQSGSFSLAGSLSGSSCGGSASGSATATCNGTTGTYSISWSVGTSENVMFCNPNDGGGCSCQGPYGGGSSGTVTNY